MLDTLDERAGDIGVQTAVFGVGTTLEIRTSA